MRVKNLTSARLSQNGRIDEKYLKANKRRVLPTVNLAGRKNPSVYFPVDDAIAAFNTAWKFARLVGFGICLRFTKNVGV